MQVHGRCVRYASTRAAPGSPTAKSSRRCHHDLPLDPQSPARRQRLIRLSSSGSSCSCRLLLPGPPTKRTHAVDTHACGEEECSSSWQNPLFTQLGLEQQLALMACQMRLATASLPADAVCQRRCTHCSQMHGMQHTNE